MPLSDKTLVRMAAKILVVEDDVGIRELLKANLVQAGYVVDLTADAEEAQIKLHYELPSLLLVDWMLPGMSGIDFARLVRHDERTRKIPIILVTARDDERDCITGFEAGADDYVVKPFSPRQLLARISAVIRRSAPEMSDQAVDVNGLRLNPMTRGVSAAGLDLQLGPTEFRLLHFLMTNANRVYSRTQLLEKVWGSEFQGDERTVDVHIRRLRVNLHPTGHADLVKTVRGSGYSFSSQEM